MIAFPALYALAFALFLVGSYRWFGTSQGPPDGVLLVPLGLPWILRSMVCRRLSGPQRPSPPPAVNLVLSWACAAGGHGADDVIRLAVVRRYGERTARSVARGAAVFAAVALTLVVAAPVARGSEAAALTKVGSWDMVAFEVKSWGRSVTSWRLLRSGSGSWTEFIDVRSEHGPRSHAVWHEVEAGEHGFDRLVTELSRLPVPAPDATDCTNHMADLSYGTIRLTRGATTLEIAWNSGCLDAVYLDFIGTIKAADSMVAAWGRAGRILRTKAFQPLR